MATEKKNRNILSVILKLLYYIVILFICLIALFLLYYIISSQLHADDPNYKPKISIYTIVSPSMTPVINVYDIVVNVRTESPKDIQVGDIITYKSSAPNAEGMTITHRVTEVSQLPDGTYEYMTQGDNNSEPDSLYVTYDTVIGKEVLIIPYLGRLQFLIANQKGWLFLLLIPVSIYLLREVIKLIDLLGLRKKVDRVIGTTEENFIEKRKIEKNKEAERKELIKEELHSKEVEKDARRKSEYEAEGFLESYTEHIVTVSENKYKKNKKKTSKEIKTPLAPDENIKSPIKAEAKKVIPNNKKKMEPLILPKPARKQEVVNEQYEILDTDELTTKIKEYDSKIEKLNKMIRDMENIDTSKIEENPIEEVDDYLQEAKVKVTKIEPVKKSRSQKVEKELAKPEKEKINLTPDYNFEFTDLIPVENIREKITRPKSEDIKEVRKKTTSSSPKTTPTKETLHLNPKEVKKINRTKKKTSSEKEPTKETKNEGKKLKLNPNEIKKVNRSTKKGKPQKRKEKTEIPKEQKKKSPLIVIEKIK